MQGGVEATLAGLNPEQQEAVRHVDGPLLVLAGAGSGKTRVITHRIAYILAAELARPRDIVAVTFTNKAAAEMRQRVEKLLGGSFDQGWVGTFHSFCLRLLRRWGDRLGYSRDFVVYDREDQLGVVRECLAATALSDENFPPRRVLDRISRAKDRCRDPEAVASAARGFVAECYARLYSEYERRLRAANAMDFDDLIVNVIRLREQAPELAERLAARCRYLLVDEYQDTNPAQYQLVRMLASRHGNVCAVGDEDQSIYRFRGADIENILRFERDFSGARVVKLERNYRSTGTIIAAASAVVDRNQNRIGKQLRTENERGEPIELHVSSDETSEASEVVRWLLEREPDYGHEGCAVLYRTNAQSRVVEEALLRRSIPYRIVGGLRFYQRREVKDVLAYARLIANPDDDVALLRSINTPPRGIGKSTVQAIQEHREVTGGSLGRATEALAAGTELPGRALRALRAFVALIEELRQEADGRPSVLIESILRRSGYLERLEHSREPDAQTRIENLSELVTAAADYDSVEGGMREFLDRVALVAETDEVKGGGGGVTLMTLHSAKGLEFPAVAIAGLEENVFPHARVGDAEDDLEEERRLFYVGLTRAEKRLLLTRAAARRSFGRGTRNEASRFLMEIPTELVRYRAGVTAGAGPRWSVDADAGAANEAALAQISSSSVETEDLDGVELPPDGAWLVGRQVRHPQFGFGTVTSSTGEGRKIKLTIRFRGLGEKTILPSYTRLEVLAKR